jgi:hypothetical protein
VSLNTARGIAHPAASDGGAAGIEQSSRSPQDETSARQPEDFAAAKLRWSHRSKRHAIRHNSEASKGCGFCSFLPRSRTTPRTAGEHSTK